MKVKRRRRRRKGVNGKRKGAGFERKICKVLSLWVTDGKNTDAFWRSAMSGGRATVQHRRGVKVRQVGDICAVAPEGQEFCEHWFTECKNVRNLSLDSFLLSNKGPLAKFWKVAQTEASKHSLEPLIIARANGPTLAITKVGALDYVTEAQLTSHARHCSVYLLEDVVSNVPAAVASMRKGKK